MVQLWALCSRCWHAKPARLYKHWLGFYVPLCGLCAEYWVPKMERGEMVYSAELGDEVENDVEND